MKMQRFYQKIVNHPKIIFLIFAIAVVLGVYCRQFVAVNYDMAEYLPEDSASTVAIDVMEEEYDGGIPNARVMVSDVSVAEALEYKEQFAAIDGVDEVTWLDDYVSVTQPLYLQDTDTVETYYRDDTALFSLTIDENLRVEVVDEIRSIIGEDNAMTGSAVSTAIASTSTESEIAKIAAFAVVFALIVLILTTTSWIEPIIVLACLGIAILINMGSNLIFGEVSFVTNAAGAILQLAVSLDYIVFLLHRFEEKRQNNTDNKAAMVDALCDSTTSILSSGLTTVIGFIALCLMRYQIGADLGLALAKGIAISLITTFIFAPNLILLLSSLIRRTQHRAFMPSFKAFGQKVTRMMIPAVIIFIILIVPCYLASGSSDFYYGSSHIFAAGTTYGDDTEEIEEVFGKSDTYVLIVPKDDTATQQELSDALHEYPQITSILSYVDTVGGTIPDTYLDEGTLSQLNSDNYTRMVLTVDEEYEGEETFTLVEEIRDTAEEYYPGAWYLAGEGVSTYDLMDTITADVVKVNLVAIGAIFLILLIVMRSISLPIILVLSIETAIWINLALPYFAGNNVFYIAYLIINSIQLGATVDYAILFADRYKEFRQTMYKKDAVVQTISSTFTSVMTSCSCLTVCGFVLGAISTHGLLAQLGNFLGVGGICSFVIVFFVLPGLLYLFDGAIQKTTKGLHFINESKAGLAHTAPAPALTPASQKGETTHEA